MYEQREVSTKEAAEVAANWQCPYIETRQVHIAQAFSDDDSAKWNTNVDALFVQLAMEIEMEHSFKQRSKKSKAPQCRLM